MPTVIAGVLINGVARREIRASRLADGLRIARLLGACVVIVPGRPQAVRAARKAAPAAVVLSVLSRWKEEIARACVRAGAHYAGEAVDIDRVAAAATRLTRRRSRRVARAA